jgi:hypothetical protein
MRVTRIPGDFNDIGERECRVWCNGHEVIDWTVADDFRRVVETPAGVHHGAVRIDLAPEVPELAPESPVDYSYTATVAVPTIEPHRSVIDEAQRVWVGGEMVVDKTTNPAKAKHIPARKRKAGK